MCGGRQNLIRSKTNRGKDWVKEQEELRVHGERKKKDAEARRGRRGRERDDKKDRREKKTAEGSGREEDKK